MKKKKKKKKKRKEKKETYLFIKGKLSYSSIFSTWSYFLGELS